MKNQTLSIEQMKHLKDLGVDVSKASMCWIDGTFIVPFERTIEQIFINDNVSFGNDNKYVPTFTLQDMLEMMPKLIVKNKSFLDIRPNVIYSDLCISYMDVNTNETIITFCSDEIIDSAYLMLCWLAENNYLNKEEQ